MVKFNWVIMMKVYLDLLFLVNFMMDFLIISMAGRILGISTKKVKTLLGAGIGGVVGCVLFFMDVSYAGILSIASIPVICAVSFGTMDIKKICKIGIVFLVESGLVSILAQTAVNFFGGETISVQNGVVYIKTSSMILLMSITCAFTLVFIYDRIFKKKDVGKKFENVEIIHRENKKTFTCMCDSGSSLQDPMLGTPIVLLPRKEVEKKFGIRKFEMQYKKDGETVAYHLIPWKTLGGEGMIDVISGCSISFENKGPCKCEIGINDTKVFGRDDIGIFNPNMFVI